MIRTRKRALALLAITAVVAGGVGPQPKATIGPVATVGGVPLDEAVFRNSLAELGGAIALEEAVIDHQLKLRLAASGAAITQTDLDAERALLLDALASESGSGGEETGKLLEAVRRSRGLGPSRYESLVRRNAGLRKLVSDAVQVKPEELALAMELEAGPRCRVRMITTESAALAAEIRARSMVEPQADPRIRVVQFAEDAMRHSTDSRAAVGGLMPSVSPSDPSLPAGVRAAVASLAPGTVSDVIAIPGGYAVVMVESRGDRADLTPERRVQIESRLRRRLERLAMNEMANTLLSEARVVVFDGSLAWSWENRPR